MAIKWGTAMHVKELRLRFRCGHCGRWAEARAEQLSAGGRGLIPVRTRCDCGALYDGSLSLDWTLEEVASR